jgi:hypothetical protein
MKKASNKIEKKQSYKLRGEERKIKERLIESKN